MTPLNPEAYLQHGVLGGFVMVLLVGIFVTYKLVSRLIDALYKTSKEQVEALISVEKAVRDSIQKSESRHLELLGLFIVNSELISETNRIVKQWSSKITDYNGRFRNLDERRDNNG